MIGLVCQSSSNPTGSGYFSEAEIALSQQAFTDSFPKTMKALSNGRINVVTKWVVLPASSKCSYTGNAGIYELVLPGNIPGWEDAVYGVNWNSLTDAEKTAKMKNPSFDTVFLFNPQPQGGGLLTYGAFVDPHHFTWTSFGQKMFQSTVPGDYQTASIVHEFLHSIVEVLYQRAFGAKNSIIAKSLPPITNPRQPGCLDCWVHAASVFGWSENMGIVDPNTNAVGSTVIPGTNIDIGHSDQSYFYALLNGKVKALPNSDAEKQGLNGYYGLTDEVLKLGNARDYWANNY